MKRIISLAALTAALTLSLPSLAAPVHAVLYKNPQCDCCDKYAAYLKQNGFDVEVKETDDLARMSQKAGVPQKLEGCHTMLVDGYVVDGLVPVALVKKLLEERPAIAGITLPGMPAGAPGMGGTKAAPFTVYAVMKDGKAPEVYAID